MEKLISLLSGRRANHSRGMQKAIREIDTSILARVMNVLDRKYHDVFVRNMSKKAYGLLQKEVGIQERVHRSAFGGQYPEIEEDTDTVCKAIEAYTTESLGEVQRYPAYGHELSFRTRREAIDTLSQISEYARDNGLMALDGLEKKTDNPMFQKALELLLLGIEPFRFDELLGNYQKRYLRDLEDTYTMIVSGIRAIYDGCHPDIVRERLESIAGGE